MASHRETSYWSLPPEERERLRLLADAAEDEVVASDERYLAQQEARDD